MTDLRVRYGNYNNAQVEAAARHLADFLHGRTDLGWIFSYDRLRSQLVWGLLDQRMPVRVRVRDGADVWEEYFG